ncbi:glucokinase [Polycladidibacter hongkongensis]|uniref:glucokinase n=1 Tax=Polycladidibacter hongkongensis TaxID=1647556 RepID=UPI00082C5D25|nr:glucokinase [Pseudovibrio hongkongensis]
MSPVTNLPQNLRFPVLVADIGGTNARFAIVENPDSETHFCGQVSTSAFASLQDAITECVIPEVIQKPRSAIVAVAGPVTGDKIPLTNAPWVIEPQQVIAALGLSSMIVVNDFEAQALALPVLDETSLIKLGGGTVQSQSSKFVLGPGTGLGAAAMLYSNSKWIPVPGEGGHVEIGPVSPEEYAVWSFIERKGGRIGAEQIICGSGLLRLSRAVLTADRIERTFAKPADVAVAAEQGDKAAQKVLRLFASALGRVSGDFALTTLARGGVYLAGGIAPKLAAWLDDGHFRASFEAKAPHEAIMQSIPTFIVKHDNPALEGLAAYARNPIGYLLELNGRLWHAPQYAD